MKFFVLITILVLGGMGGWQAMIELFWGTSENHIDQRTNDINMYGYFHLLSGI